MHRLLAAAALMFTFIACNPNYPPPDPLPAEFVACDLDTDCVLVELGCCDGCNGGETRAVAADHADAVIDQYSEVCIGETACTLVACEAVSASCVAGVCSVTDGVSP